MPLTDTAIRNAKPSEKPVRLFDGGGLYIEVSPSGGKWWRLKYRFAGKEKRLSLGVYPEVGLKEARDRREDAKQLLADGVDPSVERRVQKVATVERAASSFEAVAREWHAKYAPSWSESNAKKVLARLGSDVFPVLLFPTRTKTGRDNSFAVIRMRRSEFLALRWQDVELQDRFVRLHDTKNGDARDVPLSTRAASMLAGLPRHISGQVFPVSADAVKKSYSTRCGPNQRCAVVCAIGKQVFHTRPASPRVLDVLFFDIPPLHHPCREFSNGR
ncbi:integrase [Ralstonia solanacearum]|nr:Valine--pyruvate transaminase [Ralstonia solanacearum]AXW57248.1 integrase [Ralstonia solanacearum]NKA09879.1 integrase [Ralstonia solanacearum]NKA14146.1 integrase [Ralstonia solanacearum]NKA48158.1 integrase [Ralstonia solanacearum]